MTFAILGCDGSVKSTHVLEFSRICLDSLIIWQNPKKGSRWSKCLNLVPDSIKRFEIHSVFGWVSCISGSHDNVVANAYFKIDTFVKVVDAQNS